MIKTLARHLVIGLFFLFSDARVMSMTVAKAANGREQLPDEAGPTVRKWKRCSKKAASRDLPGRNQT